jgi:hypothetical protein
MWKLAALVESCSCTQNEISAMDPKLESAWFGDSTLEPEML